MDNNIFLAKIPTGLISRLSELLSDYFTHSQITMLFLCADLPSEFNPSGNKLDRCNEWFRYCNENSKNPIDNLGKILEYYMEKDPPDNYYTDSKNDPLTILKNNTSIILKKYGYQYISPGKILKIGNNNGSTKSLEDYIKEKNFAYLEEDFKRALINLENDPPSSLTAACTIIETVCKAYIEECNLEIPKKKDIKHLWNTVASDLGLEAKKYEDEDLKKILSGLSSIVDGVGGLRTHAGSAHGRTIMRMNIEGRHARLAVHAAHTIVMFLLETWQKGLK